MKRYYLAAVLVALSSPSIAQTKADIFGFEPGMALQEVKQLVAAKSYTCKSVLDGKSPFIECIVDGSEVTTYFSKELKDNPAVVISVGLPNAQNAATRAASIANQFGVSVGSEVKGRWVWNIGKGNVLTYNGIGLILSNPQLKKQNDEADQAAAKRGTPKF